MNSIIGIVTFFQFYVKTTHKSIVIILNGDDINTIICSFVSL